MYKYMDVSHFDLLGVEGRGTVDALWLQSPEGFRFLWKNEPSRDARLSEIMAYEISKQLNLQCAEYSLALYEGQQGVLSKDIDYYGISMRNLLEVYPSFETITSYTALSRFFDVA